MSKVRVISLALGVLTALGCNQKDPVEPGTGNSSSSYFPLVDGARWTYAHSNGGWSEEVTIEQEGDRFIQTQEGDPGGESSVSTFVLDDGDVLRVEEDLLLDGELVYTAVYDPGFLRFSAAWADAEPNDSETRTYDRTETEAGMEPKAAQPRAHTYTVESVDEDVSVPAGTFRNCLRVHRARALDDPSIDDPTAQTEQEKLFWFCEDVGKVREENVISGSTEVLTEYEIPEPDEE
jgi:hypothetical protein